MRNQSRFEYILESIHDVMWVKCWLWDEMYASKAFRCTFMNCYLSPILHAKTIPNLISSPSHTVHHKRQNFQRTTIRVYFERNFHDFHIWNPKCWLAIGTLMFCTCKISNVLHMLLTKTHDRCMSNFPKLNYCSFGSNRHSMVPHYTNLRYEIIHSINSELQAFNVGEEDMTYITIYGCILNIS